MMKDTHEPGVEPVDALPFSGPAEAAAAAEAAEVEQVGGVSAEPVADENAAAGAALLAGKFESTEDLEKAYGELQTRFGQQGAELGELRSRLAEVDSYADDTAAQVLLAHEQGDQETLEVMFDVWADEDPAAANAWLQQARAAEAQRTADALAQDQQAWNEAVAIVSERIPDFGERAQQLMSDTATQHPAILASVVNGDAAEKAQALVSLYQLGQAGEAQDLRDAVRVAATEQAEAARELRQSSFVASAESTTPREPEASAAEKETERMKEVFGADSFQRNWIGRGDR